MAKLERRIRLADRPVRTVSGDCRSDGRDSADYRAGQSTVRSNCVSPFGSFRSFRVGLTGAFLASPVMSRQLVQQDVDSLHMD